MVKLTEEMIVARTRVSDMNNVKKLNCWGAELTDISVLRKLVNVEVLSLSVNCISTLADVQNCKNLQELYIRKNKIPDLSEICWLSDLPKLKSLWLEENPCVQSHGDIYRVTVIRNLPQLQKLDNLPVQSDEMADAMRRGMELVHPLDRDPATPYHNVQSPYQPQPTSEAGRRRSLSYERGGSNQPQPEEQQMSRRTSAVEQNSPYMNGRRGVSQPSSSYADDPQQGYIPEYHTGRRYSTVEHTGMLTRRSPHNSQSGLNEGMRRMSVHESQPPLAQPTYDDAYERAPPQMRPQQYHNEETRYGYKEYNQRQQQVQMESQRAMVAQHYEQTYEQANHQIDSAQQILSGGRKSYSPERPYPRRPKNRNSNILSAVLCLIKELDGPSLEVAEMAIRCRMEELED